MKDPGGKNIKIVLPFWLLTPPSWLLEFLRLERF
jgi:hypothetical protein